MEYLKYGLMVLYIITNQSTNQMMFTKVEYIPNLDPSPKGAVHPAKGANPWNVERGTWNMEHGTCNEKYPP